MKSTLAVNVEGHLVIETLRVVGVMRIGRFLGFLTRLGHATVTTD